MEKIELKKKMLEASIRKHQRVIDDFSARLKELKEEGVVLTEEGYQQPQRPYNEQIIPETDALNRQMQFANEEMDLLYKLQNQNGELHDQAGLGSAVETDKGTFFVSASIEQFSVDGREIMGLSTKSPLFLAMKGKRKDETFTYNQTTYKITDVY